MSPSILQPSSNHELITTLIGGRHAAKRAHVLLNQVGDIQHLSQMSIPELMAQGNLTQSMALRLHSGFKIGQRSLHPIKPTDSITKPDQVYPLVWPLLRNQSNELLIALFLNRRKHLIQQEILTQGTDWMTIVDPKQIYHKALLCRSSGLILVHNHPSGDPTPSEQDIRITREIERFGSLLKLPLLDHIIVGGDSYISLAALGLLFEHN